MSLGPSLAHKVLASKTLSSWITPVAQWYANVSGYRKYGLKYDDLSMLPILGFLSTNLMCLFIVMEENEDVQRARVMSLTQFVSRIYCFFRPLNAWLLVNNTIVLIVSNGLLMLAFSMPLLINHNGRLLNRYVVYRSSWAYSDHRVNEQDVRYLSPHIVEVEKEERERVMWDTALISRRK